jgi:hypothetical protein
MDREPPAFMTDRQPTVVVTADETLSDVIQRLRGAARGGRVVQLVVPIDSALLLTASEFRALSTAIDEDRIAVQIRTSDPLRLRLAEQLGLDARAVERPRVAEPVVAPLVVAPPLALPEPEPAVVPDTNGYGAAVAMPRLDPASHWPVQHQAAGAEAVVEHDDSPSEPGAERASDNSPRRWLPVAAGMVVVVALAFLALRFVLPGAVIRIVPKTATVASSLVFDVTPDGQPLDSRAAFALAPTSRTLELVWEGSAPATNVRVVPDGTATGPIELRNASGEVLNVDAGTVVATETGTEFTFSDAVTVPAADPATGEPGAASGQVQAVNAGSGGNIDNGELGGRLPNGLYYSNRMEPTEGGTDKEFPVVAQADLDALSQQATAAAATLAADALIASGDGEGALLSTVTVTDKQDTYDRKVDEEAEQVSLQSSMVVELKAYDLAAAEAAWELKLESQLAIAAPDGFNVPPKEIVFAAPKELEQSDRGVRLEVTANAVAVATLDEAEQRDIAERLAGARPEEAAAILAEIPEISEASIEYQPSWLPQQIPTSTGRIQFEFEK